MIVQPYVPKYRQPLFEGLSDRLREHGHELIIVSGQPQRGQAVRGDAVGLSSTKEHLYKSRSVRFGAFTVRLAPSPRVWKGADAVIVELAAGSLASYRALLGRLPVGVWGHVGSYVARDRTLLRWLRAWQVRRADHVLAYTETGIETAVAYGARVDDVTAVMNTVDTTSLRRAVLAERERPENDVRADLGDLSGPLFAVIGGLDESKRIDLLVSTLDHLWASRSNIRFVVAGKGALEHLLHPARDRGQIVLVGYADDAVKARMARVCTAIFNPGRVGLIAVESLVLGLPIVAGAQQDHAPEFEYLRPDQDCVIVAPDAPAMAAALVGLTLDPVRTSSLARAAEARADEYPLDFTISAMFLAIEALLSKRDRRGTPEA
ncbi:glycosyltransferase [Curtobacterium sp. MCBA15_004]|uniref:glycosyltransferase n=1 Tax=unclassified Curtobacterium TaxID=257496 RepID=UPI0020C86C32|nr:glycosyltransferase [Curtobacterium sp. MCBA15_004]WIA98552.1 glycosyltransferase [Curtobacterium sp. MCBA15_004]